MAHIYFLAQAVVIAHLLQVDTMHLTLAPTVFVEQHLETRYEGLGRQRISLSHGFLDWYPDWVREWLYISRTDRIHYLDCYEYYDIGPFLYKNTQPGIQLNGIKTFCSPKEGRECTCAPLRTPSANVIHYLSSESSLLSRLLPMKKKAV